MDLSQDMNIPSPSSVKPVTGPVVQIDEGRIHAHLDEVVRATVKETLNALLDAEADQLCGARKYERTEGRKDTTPTYQVPTTPRNAAYPALYQPGNYRFDMSLRRTFNLPTGHWREGTQLMFEADAFNITNHTHFVYSSSNSPITTWSPTSTSYGTMTVDTGAQTNRAVQLAARILF